MTPRTVLPLCLLLGPRLLLAAPSPSPSTCLQQIETAAEAFYTHQLDGALHYYKSWLPGYELAPPVVHVQVQHGNITAHTFESQVDVDADVKLGYSRSEPVQCRNPLPAKMHPVSACSYHLATVHLRQTSKVSCRRADTWRCGMERSQLQSSCKQVDNPDAPPAAGATASMCGTYANSWLWGRTEDRRAGFHARLAAFMANQLNAASKNPSCPMGPPAATASDGN